MGTKFKFIPLSQFCATQRDLLQKEYNTEISEATAVLAEDSRTEVVSRGIAILNLRFDSMSPSLFGKSILSFKHHLSYSKKKEGMAIFTQHSLSSGDIVGVFQNSFKSAPVVKGVIHSIDTNSVKLIPDTEFEDVRLSENESFDVARIGSRVTHERLVRTLNALEKSHHSLIHYMFEDDSAVPTSGVRQELTSISDTLNGPQRSAVQNALSNSLVTVVHGPAGTGKTTTLACIIAEAVRHNPNIKILACAPSNVAVDNLASRVLSQGVSGIVRLGHPVRVDASLMDHTLDSLVRRSDYYESCRDIESELSALLKSAKPQWSEIRLLRKDLKSRQAKSILDVFNRSNVVFATCNGSFGIVDKFGFPPDFFFDVCVIDECAQGLEMSSWIPVLQARRIVLGGDHKQLSATVKSIEAAAAGLGMSLFERVHDRFCDDLDITNLLTVQYRMNEVIMGWSNGEFYDRKLSAHESNRTWTLKPDPNAVPVMLDGVIDFTPIVESPFVFCDTAGVDGMTENSDLTSSSKFNLGEVLVVKKYMELVLRAIHRHTQVSIISPYLMQVEKLQEAVKNDQVEISTVDSFQGRENDLIIISLVRSNPTKIVGFLADYRRLNVAVTRARKQVFIVGNSDTISHDPILKSLFQYATNSGTVISAQSFVREEDVHALGLHTLMPNHQVTKTKPKQKQSSKNSSVKFAPLTDVVVSSVNQEEVDIRSKYEAQISALSEHEKFFFPNTLSGASRKIIHDICDKAGFGHGSVGEGPSRQIWVQKAKPLPATKRQVEIVPSGNKRPSNVSAQPQEVRKVERISHVHLPQHKPEPKSTPPAEKPVGICPHEGCPMSIKLVSLECKHCNRTFCIAHATPECHGCGDAAKHRARVETKVELKRMKNPPIIQPKGSGGVSTEQLRRKMDAKLHSMESRRKRT